MKDMYGDVSTHLSYALLCTSLVRMVTTGWGTSNGYRSRQPAEAAEEDEIALRPMTRYDVAIWLPFRTPAAIL